jgi:hypothetical protein
MEVLISDKPTTIGACVRSHNMVKVEKALNVLVFDLAASFEVEFNQNQVDEIVAEITSGVLINLSFEDVYFVFRQMKFSDTYGKLNLNKILKSLEQHLDERSKIITKENHSRHLSFNYTEPSDTYVQELSQKLSVQK